MTPAHTSQDMTRAVKQWAMDAGAALVGVADSALAAAPAATGAGAES